MQINDCHITKKWFLVILFAGYVSGISFFTHRHVVDNVVYVHSHPFQQDESKQHTHTQNQIVLLDQLFHTQITSDVVPYFDLSEQSTPLQITYTTSYEGISSVKSQLNTLLRAPPAA